MSNIDEIRKRLARLDEEAKEWDVGVEPVEVSDIRLLLSHIDELQARLDSAEKVVEAAEIARSAIKFFDKVNSASGEERTAAGTDHHDWLESSARAVVNALQSHREREQ